MLHGSKESPKPSSGSNKTRGNTQNVSGCLQKKRMQWIVWFEVLTAVVMKSTIFWDITPCSPLSVNRRFGGTCRLLFQGRRIRRVRNQRESRCQAELWLWRDIFLRNVGWLPTNYTTLYPRRNYYSCNELCVCVYVCEHAHTHTPISL
jgi:hypothetical protein